MTQNKNELPNILTEFESEELLNQPNLRYPTGMRNYALMKLLLNSGIKLSEATNLLWTDLDLITGDLILKGDNILKSRIINLDGETLETLINWKNRQQINADDCRYIFTTLSGNPLKKRYVRAMIKRYADKAYILENVSPQTLRHTYATNLYVDTKDLSLVRSCLGLSDSHYSKIYLRLAEDNFDYII
jgi:site-specific recombinase XerD